MRWDEMEELAGSKANIEDEREECLRWLEAAKATQRGCRWCSE